MKRDLYAILEGEDKRQAPVFIENAEEALKLNERYYGIFHCVNEFTGARRKENLARLLSWYVDIDGDKELTRAQIKKCPLKPSQVVESKNGFHLYWDGRGILSVDNYVRIEEGLIEYFQADPKAKDMTRLLRAPGYMHWKDRENPFLVQVVSEARVNYQESAMLYYFDRPVLKKARPHVKGGSPAKLNLSSGEAEVSLTAKLDNLNSEVALMLLSGKACVNHEVYTFEPTARGRKNILVNGKATSCFIDEKGRIGAKPGGPTVFQWLKYFGHSNQDVARILRFELGL